MADEDMKYDGAIKEVRIKYKEVSYKYRKVIRGVI